MRLLVLAAGRRDPFEAQSADYLKRAEATGRALGISGVSLKTIEAPRAMSGAVRQAKETELFLAALPDRARVVLLDETGKDRPSRALAGLVAAEQASGAPDLVFLIGGADGFDDALHQAVKPRLAGTLAFGRATWPHMMVRLMLAEQLYRATTILSGHPYHRD